MRLRGFKLKCNLIKSDFQRNRHFFLFLSIFGEVVLFCNKGKLTTLYKMRRVLLIWVWVWLFPLLFQNGCFQSSRFLPQARRIGDENRVERAMRLVSDGELCMCACHTNHSVGCIKVQIKLPVRKWNDVFINLETCQITVVCLVRHFTCHRFNSAISKTFQFTKSNSCTPCVPMFFP